MKIRNDDSVVVLTGKDRGKTGSVTKVLSKTNRVVVEGINTRVKHVKKREGQPGERIEFSAPLHISNVAVVDSKTGKPTRVKYEFEGKEKVRIAVRSGEKIVAQKAKPAKDAKKATEAKEPKKIKA